MSDLGKVPPDFFDERIRPYLGADRSDVRLGPTHGVDFGVVDVGDAAVAVATDPVSVLPDLGFDRAGRFALDVVLADVAVSGLPPSHLAISFTLPPEMEDQEFEAAWRAIDAEASDLGVSIVTGHTARYAGCSYPWIGGATAFAVGDPADLIRPDGARPGDDLLVTKGPAVEATGLLTTLFPDQIDLSPALLDEARSRLDEASCVRDATTAAAAGPVTAMHDATEGGLHGALVEMAESAGVRFDVDRSSIPLRPGVMATCDALDIDPWAATTSGSLVLAVDAAGSDAVLSALEARGRPSPASGRSAGATASTSTANGSNTRESTRRGRPTSGWRDGRARSSGLFDPHVERLERLTGPPPRPNLVVAGRDDGVDVSDPRRPFPIRVARGGRALGMGVIEPDHRLARRLGGVDDVYRRFGVEFVPRVRIVGHVRDAPKVSHPAVVADEDAAHLSRRVAGRALPGVCEESPADAGRENEFSRSHDAWRFRTTDRGAVAGTTSGGRGGVRSPPRACRRSPPRSGRGRPRRG